MASIDSKTAKAIAEEIVAASAEVSKLRGVAISFAGGSLRDGKAILKIQVTPMGAAGSVDLDSRTKRVMEIRFDEEHITYTGELIGSIWDTPKRGMVRIIDYHPSRPKYAVEFEDVSGERRLAPVGYFRNARQLQFPDEKAFHWYLAVDPDLLSDLETKRFDMINNYLTLWVPDAWRDKFYDAINGVIERGVSKRVSARVWSILKQEFTSWTFLINMLNAVQDV